MVASGGQKSPSPVQGEGHLNINQETLHALEDGKPTAKNPTNQGKNMSETHPSRWTIRHESNRKSCQILDLPLGKDTRPIKISTKLFNRVYREWDGKSKGVHAGTFAQALRELRTHSIDLGALPQVSHSMVTAAYTWLDDYEIKVSQFALRTQQKVKKKAEGVKKQLEPNAVATLHDQAFLAALNGFATRAGPLADPTLIVERARLVANEAVKP